MKLHYLNTVGKLRKHWMMAGIISFLMICNSFMFSNTAFAQLSDPLVSVISLEDMSAFKNPPKNWHVAADIFFDLNKEKITREESGSGILIKSAKNNDNLLTKFEHGDMDLEFDFMLPKGSNTAVYLQGRYGIRLNDSWSDAGSIAGASGAIDVPPADKKQSGYTAPPRMNVCKAPGLWQNLKVSFRAPKFDKAGKKIAHATFDKIVYNGLVIHENIEVPGTTFQSLANEEKPLGPLMFSGAGEIAIRNIRYKMYGEEKVQLDQLRYSYYNGEFNEIPEDTSPSRSGELQKLTWEVVGNPPAFALKFDGQLYIPKSGTYVFQIETWYASELTIDGQTVMTKGEEVAAQKLEKGNHTFSLICIKEKRRGKPLLGLFVEGPGIARHPLHKASSLPTGPAERPITVKPDQRTIVQRCFIADGGEKKTFCVAVGEPGQIHYAMDLSQGAIIKLWRGRFIDATTMWTSRGEEQVAIPLGSIVELSPEPAFAMLQNEDEAWPVSMQAAGNYKFEGYRLDGDGRPTFRYSFNGVSVEDKIVPEANNKYLTRVLKVGYEKDVNNLWLRLAKGKTIERLPDGLYGIDDKTFYIKVDDSVRQKPIIRKGKDGEELLIPVEAENGQTQLKYSIIW